MTTAAYSGISQEEYKRRIRAWTMYDWANSAFATTVLAAVLPIYFSQVAGITLPSPAIATAYWSRALSIGFLIVAIISPVLGTISDVMRGKKRFLAVFAGLGILSTGFLVLVEKGLSCYYTKVLKIINQENNKPLSTGKIPHQGAIFYSAKKYGTPLLNLLTGIAILLEV